MEKKLVAATNSKVRNYIPNDIVISILSKLPLKSLTRFGCVKKSWSLLFENHQFMNMFRINLFSNSHCCSYYNGASLFLRVFEDHKYNIYSLSGKRFEKKVKLDSSSPFENHFNFRIYGFGSINGILCLYENSYYGKIVLWNPTTQEIKLIPPSPVESIRDSLFVILYIHGFGYDYLINDYKVIRYVYLHGHISLEGMEDISLHPFWEIYSLKSNLWRKLDVEMPSSSLYCIEGAQVYNGGVCHWLGGEGNPVRLCLVSFYLNNEVFFKTPIPLDDDYYVFHNSWWINLVVLNESNIAMISYHQDKTFRLSILGEFGMEESWTKLLTVGPLSCVQRPVGMGTKGEIFFIRNDEELVLLDLSTQIIEELGYKEINCSSRITIYKENNLPIGRISN